MYLACHSYYSLRYGVLSPEGLLEEAKRCGVHAFALTDINNCSGWFELLAEAKKYDIHVVPGIDFKNSDTHLFIGIARNQHGFAELNRYLSQFLNSKEPIPAKAPTFEHAVVIYPYVPDKHYALEAHEYVGIHKHDLSKLRVGKNGLPQEKLLATLPVTFINKKDYNAHRILRAIDHNTIITKLPATTIADPTEVFRPYERLYEDFGEYGFLLENARALLESCSFDFTYHTNKNIKSFSGNEAEDVNRLLQLTYDGVHKRYGKLTKTIQDRINKELEIIIQKGFVSYFLINWDIIRYAHSQHYFTIGRGSGANSLIAYCMGITDVDPIELDLYFERFINLFRETPPDFDLDFSWKDRDDVTRYIFERYGTEHTTLLATYTTFKSRSFIREVAKTFGLPKYEIDAMIKNYGESIFGDAIHIPDKIARSIYHFGSYVQGNPNYLGIHAGGVLISELPIYYYTATHLPPKGFPTTQFDMHVAEDIGLYKFDILSQRGLGHIKETVEIVAANQDKQIDITQVQTFKQDPVLNANLVKGNTIGCFYIESPAMRSLLNKLLCDNYLTLVAASSIIRPGVAQSGMMDEYIRRHRFPEERTRIHPVMGDIMPDTYGVMVYQEDVIKVAHYFAKLTLSEADVLRRGMSGKSRSKDEFQRIKTKYFENCIQLGYDKALAADVWHQIESFAGYSFAKGHSASYAVESYQSLHLKSYYPLEFMVAVINNFGGYYSTELYFHEARKNGAHIEAPCINNSTYNTRITGKTIYVGFVHLTGLETALAEQLLAEREQNGAYTSLDNFLDRIPIHLEQLELLITINAFRFTGILKRELLIEAYTRMHKSKKSTPGNTLFEKAAPVKYTFPPLHSDPRSDAWDEIKILGFPLTSPFLLIDDPIMQNKICVKAIDFPKYVGKTVEIVGYLITTKRTSTKNGEPMYLGTFIDPDGNWVDTAHFPAVAKQYRFKGKACYLLKGRIQESFQAYTLIVSEMHHLRMWVDE
ncbi:MAG TPA: DNA polymerase III subunit alpha [Chitinophagales bacterium]|nr:DNA polymerase III subunit alpha [Chitinophagales bacterium]